MTLPEYWFLAMGFLFTGYFVLEGFDFGVGMLLPILGRRGHADSERRRRVLLNTIGPIWDGNEVWLITAGAAMFAAFPEWYATVFSGFYLPLLAILVGLIVRVCALEWRGKIEDPRWRGWADFGIGMGSWLPAILWGVAFANIVRGVPMDAGHHMTGDLFDLLGPYALLGGLATCLLFLFHGTVFVSLKSGGAVRTDAARLAVRLGGPVTIVGGTFALWTQLQYGKTWTWAAVAAAAAGLLLAWVLAWRNTNSGGAPAPGSGSAVAPGSGGAVAPGSGGAPAPGSGGAVAPGSGGAPARHRLELGAFAATSVAIIAVGVLLFGSLFPNVLPALGDPANDLTIAGASSTDYTLTVMSWSLLVVLPVVIGYQGWTYWVFRKRISVEQIPPSIGLSIDVRD